MDRNQNDSLCQVVLKGVATREGGVDRNNSFQLTRSTKKVATREGGVDRNSRSWNL